MLLNEHGSSINKIFMQKMNYSSIALFCILKENSTKENILVVNTHLIYKQWKGDLKLAMIALIMKSILRILSAFKISDFFFCGDFNIIPNSMLYQFISTGEIELEASLEEYSNQLFIKSYTNYQTLQELIASGDKKFKSNFYENVKMKKINKDFLRSLVQIQIEFPDTKLDENELKVVDNTDKIESANKGTQNESKMTADKQSQSKPTDKKFNKNELKVTENIASIFKMDSEKSILENLSRSVFLKSSYSEFRNQYWKVNQNNKANLKKLHMYWSPEFYNNEVFVTQFGSEIRNPLDYIWFGGSGNYRVVRILDLPNPFVLFEKNISMPNKFNGSDHFPIVADFLYVKKSV